MRVDRTRQGGYREAYEGWQKQSAGHAADVPRRRPAPSPQLKGLLNRETRAKERYDAARLALPGLGGGEDDPFSECRVSYSSAASRRRY